MITPLMSSKPQILGANAQWLAWLARPLTISDRERRLLTQIEQRPRRTWRARERIAAPGRATLPIVIMAGWACRMRQLADGRRQIIELLAPGDMVGVTPGLEAVSEVMALTPVKAVEADELRRGGTTDEARPAIRKAVTAAARTSELFTVHAMVRLGRQTAYERIAHLLLELDWRLTHRGLSTNSTFKLPLTQEVIGDVLGLSVVHVNRTLQQMRREKVLEFMLGQVRLLQPLVLKKAAEFDEPDITSLGDA